MDTPTPTTTATSTETTTPTPADTPTPTPTETPSPTPTPTPDLTATYVADCTPRAEFVRHLTIPDGTTLSPDARFTKSWLLRNTSQCPWPEGCRLAFVSGTQMGGPDEQEIDALPDFTETVTISVSLVAPASAENYEGIWQIQDDNGNPIGETFRVFIRVGPTPTPELSYPPPVLDPVSIIGTNVTFRWSWSGALKEDEWFAVRVGKGEPLRAVVWVKEYEYTYSLPSDLEGDYSWEIKICRGDPATGICEQLAVSERSVFAFGGDTLTKTPPPP
jgi:hypothetical protein